MYFVRSLLSVRLSVSCNCLLTCRPFQVSVEEGEDRAKAEGIMFIETSAKGGYNIKVQHYFRVSHGVTTTTASTYAMIFFYFAMDKASV